MRALIATVLAAAILAAAPAAGAAAAAAPVSYAGKTVLVTGSTDGLGRELARALAAQGAHVIVHGRNVQRGEALVAEIAASGSGSARFVAADLASVRQVREFAAQLRRDVPKLHLLVNNAGVAFNRSQPRRESTDGYELQFAVNYLAGWIPVHELRPALAAAAPSRVLNIASGSASPIDFADVMLRRPGAQGRGYGQSKLAQVMMTIELAPGFLADGITMVSAHPASQMDTTMVRGLGVTPRSTVAEGRDHVLGVLSAPVLRAGAYYRDGQPSVPHPQAGDAAVRTRLAALSRELTGVPAD